MIKITVQIILVIKKPVLKNLPFHSGKPVKQRIFFSGFTGLKTGSKMKKTIYQAGFLTALLAFIATLSYVVVQLLQVARVLYFPAGEIFIYATSLGIVIPFLLAMLALHYTAPPDKKFRSHAALLFTIIYAVFVTANYVVQLATVIPAKLNNNAGELTLLEQTPHSLFWDFDALGYIFMGMAMLAALPVFERKGFQRWVRMAFLAHALETPLIDVVYF